MMFCRRGYVLVGILILHFLLAVVTSFWHLCNSLMSCRQARRLPHILSARQTEGVAMSSADPVSQYRFSAAEIEEVQRRLLRWYRRHRRHLPWRGDTVEGRVPPTVTPYGVWVSEVMLQQTRVETVIPYWNKWMEVI